MRGEDGKRLHGATMVVEWSRGKNISRGGYGGGGRDGGYGPPRGRMVMVYISATCALDFVSSFNKSYFLFLCKLCFHIEYFCINQVAYSKIVSLLDSDIHTSVKNVVFLEWWYA